jgi:hypothetical protein
VPHMHHASRTFIAWEGVCGGRGEGSKMCHFTLSACCPATTVCPLSLITCHCSGGQ